MPSKGKNVREAQQAYWEKKLSQRLGVLDTMGVSPGEIEKDTAIRGIRAKIRETKLRIKAIAAAEAKLAEMVRIREEKKAAPPKEKGKKATEEALAPKEGKKKAKAEKKEPKVPKEPKEPKEPKAEKPKKEKPPKEAKAEPEPSQETPEATS
jgi:hypothetical protein